MNEMELKKEITKFVLVSGLSIIFIGWITQILFFINEDKIRIKTHFTSVIFFYKYRNIFCGNNLQF